MPSLDPFHDIDPLSFSPNADDNIFQNDHDEEDEEQWLMYIHAGEVEILMRKIGLRQIEVLMIYLKLTRTENISLRL